MQWILLAAVLYIIYRDFVKPRIKKPKPSGWKMKFTLTDGVQTITVPENIYQEIKVWLRGEGDSLYEIATEESYLGLRRAYVIKVTAVRK